MPIPYKFIEVDFDEAKCFAGKFIKF